MSFIFRLFTYISSFIPKKIYMLTFSHKSKKKFKFHPVTHYFRVHETVRKLKIMMNNDNNKNVDKLFLKGPVSCTNTKINPILSFTEEAQNKRRDNTTTHTQYFRALQGPYSTHSLTRTPQMINNMKTPHKLLIGIVSERTEAKITPTAMSSTSHAPLPH